MKARKFWKSVLKIKYLVALLIVIALSVVAVLYFAVGITPNTIKLDNMEFSSEGFENFAGKSDEETNKCKKVAETDKYIMFINESTTIVTVAVKSSLISGQDKNDPKSYKIKYDTASTKEGAILPDLANFTLTYSSTEISKPVTKTLDSYTSSVRFSNVLTGQEDKHYSIKYLEDKNAVQVYYTIGEFTSISSYFPNKLYSTVYEPARCLYDSDEEWEAAVAEYENGYLATVGNIANTFEERFRGNVRIINKQTKDEAGSRYIISYTDTIEVYSQEARDYIINVVLPELEAEGIEVPSYDIEELNNEARENIEKNGKEKVQWKLEGIPLELLDYNGEYYHKYFNNENSPLTNNPFMLNTHFVNLSPNMFKEYKADGNTIPYSFYQLAVNPGPAATELYSRFYSDKQAELELLGKTYKFVQEVDGEYIPVVSAGYVARDEEGNFVHDEEGKCVRQLYTVNQVDEDNKLFGYASAGVAAFKIALEFKLTDTGLVVTVPTESLVDSTNVSKDDPEYGIINGRYQIVNVKICPNMTNVDSSQDGYMIIPDGSGAIIKFNNKKISNISANYYGKDLAYVDPVKIEESAQLLLGMFAFVNTTEANPGGLLAIVEKGGGQVALTAGVANNTNYASLTATLRSKEIVATGTVADTERFDKFDKILSPSDIVINYMILDETETDYTTIAAKYRDYLVKRDGLTLKDNTNSLVNDLTILGTYEKYALFLGVKYKTADTLTTFEQAEEIINELYTNKVDNLNITYKGWSNEYLEYELGGSLKVANVLGKTASMRSFYSICVDKGIAFYPELSITTAKGYDYLFGSTKYTARGVANEESVHYEYDLATGRPNKKLNPTYAISPLFYKSITEKILADFAKLKVWDNKANGGFHLTDLGNQWNGNYRNNSQVYGSDAILYQQEVLAMIAENNLVKIDAPCDYAFKYVDIATNVPVSSAMYTIYDETIPFYQLVINGLFDYTTEHINGLSNRSSAYYFAKLLETGANPSYIISAEDPAVLLETDYTQYYQAYYQNWKQTIINFTNEINNLGIHNCYLTKHENINGLSRVTYTNKTNPSQQLVLVINVTDTAKTYNGTSIPGYGYIKEK